METKGHYYFGSLLGLAMITALGGLLFGYDIAVISGAIPYLENYFSLDSSGKGFLVSSALIGCIAGVVFAGRISDRIGRKIPLLAAALLFTVSAIGSGLAHTVSAFIFYRLIGGLAVGTASILAPMYIAEISPAKIRGKMVSFNQLNIVIGIALAYFINYFLEKTGENAWRWMFAAEAIPALLFFAFLFVVPESPRWLVKRLLESKARETLARVGDAVYVENEMAEIHKTLQHPGEKSSFFDIFKKKYVLILFIGVGLAVLQQWSGINTILFYAPDILKSINVPIETALLQTTLIGVTNLVFTLLAMWLVDKIGRKILLMLGAAGMGTCYVLIGLFYYLNITTGLHLLVTFLATTAFYSASLAPVVWVVISEIFPNKIRGAGMSVATFFLWIACYVLTFTFPIMTEKLNSANTFWIYALICYLGFVFVLRIVPETKGRSLEELEKELIKK
jgi:sugar porter (SP) family MFS transporter